MDANNGLIFNMQRYSLHDGTGIRTIVFFKGCPLACRWCANPESQAYTPQVLFSSKNCMGCGNCLKACDSGALTQAGWDSLKCLGCGECAQVCPTGARELAGKVMSVEEVVREATKDWAFFQSSSGGVTFSGGEPLMQASFAERLAERLKALYFDLAIETCGYAKWENAKKVLKKMDQVLYDIKLMNEDKHREYTGVSNKLILGNAEKCAELGKNMIIRVPVIGGVNDDEDNIDKTAAFAKNIGVKEIHLLPYHRYGEPKYEKLGKDYAFNGYTPDDAYMERLQEIVRARGIDVKTGG